MEWNRIRKIQVILVLQMVAEDRAKTPSKQQQQQTQRSENVVEIPSYSTQPENSLLFMFLACLNRPPK